MQISSETSETDWREARKERGRRFQIREKLKGRHNLQESSNLHNHHSPGLRLWWCRVTSTLAPRGHGLLIGDKHVQPSQSKDPLMLHPPLYSLLTHCLLLHRPEAFYSDPWSSPPLNSRYLEREDMKCKYFV